MEWPNNYNQDEDIINQLAVSPAGYAYKDPAMDFAFPMHDLNNLHGHVAADAYGNKTQSQLTIQQALTNLSNPQTQRNELKRGNSLTARAMSYDEEQYVDYCAKNFESIEFDFHDLFGLDEKKKKTVSEKSNIHDFMTNTCEDVDRPSNRHGKIQKGRSSQEARISPYSVPSNRPVRQDSYSAIRMPVVHMPEEPQLEYIEVPVNKCTDIENYTANSIHDHIDQTVSIPTCATIEATSYDSGESDVEVLIQDPLTKNQYSIGIHKLSRALEEFGTPMDKPQTNVKTQKQIEDTVKKFCNARDLSFMKAEDAKEIVDSGREVVNIPLKGKKEDGQFKCMVCPLVQGHGRGFDRKEDLKRHNQLHFKFARFLCKHCQYGNSRTDHMKLHIRKCHQDKDEKDYTRT